MSRGPTLTAFSQEGFQPVTFRSSRGSRQAVVQQSVDNFLDDDELEVRNRSVLTIKVTSPRVLIRVTSQST